MIYFLFDLGLIKAVDNGVVSSRDMCCTINHEYKPLSSPWGVKLDRLRQARTSFDHFVGMEGYLTNGHVPSFLKVKSIVSSSGYFDRH